MDKVDVSKTTAGQPAKLKPKWRRAVVATSVVGGMLLSGMSVLPWAVMSSSYRDAILNSRLQKNGLTARSAAGAGGWLTALSFDDVKLVDETGQVTCTIKSIRLSKSLLSIIVSERDLGDITIVQPDLRVSLDENGQLPPKLRGSSEDVAGAAESANSDAKWDVAFDVQSANFLLSVPWRPVPIVDVKSVDISGDVTTEESGRWLTVNPIQIFDREPLSELHTEQNLALVAPVLSQSTELSGEVSARLERIRMLLGDKDASPWPVQGSATLHSVEATLKKQWAQQVSQLIGSAMGGTGGGGRLTIAQDSVVDFEVNDQGVYHHGLAFLLPDLAGNMNIQSSGLVGLDETVDLSLAMQFPQLAPRNAFMAAITKLVRNPIQLNVTGTISEPKLVTPPGMSVVDQLSGNLSPETQGTPPPTVPGAVIEMIGSSAGSHPDQAADAITGGILNIIRAAQEAKKNAPPRESREARRERKRREREGL